MCVLEEKPSTCCDIKQPPRPPRQQQRQQQSGLSQHTSPSAQASGGENSQRVTHTHTRAHAQLAASVSAAASVAPQGFNRRATHGSVCGIFHRIFCERRLFHTSSELTHATRHFSHFFCENEFIAVKCLTFWRQNEEQINQEDDESNQLAVLMCDIKNLFKSKAGTP